MITITGHVVYRCTVAVGLLLGGDELCNDYVCLVGLTDVLLTS